MDKFFFISEILNDLVCVQKYSDAKVKYFTAHDIYQKAY